LLEYDNVMNIMRTEIYKRRRAALTGENLDDVLFQMLEDYLEETFLSFCGQNVPSPEWNWEGLRLELLSTLTLQIEERHDVALGEFVDQVLDLARAKLLEKKITVDQIDPALFERVKRVHILRTIDDFWKDHLYEMDCLREGINYQAYGQKDPLIEYKKEGFSLFAKMLQKVNKIAVERVFNTTVTIEENPGRQSMVNVRFSKAEAAPALSATTQAQPNSSQGIVPGMEGAPQPIPKQQTVVAGPKVSPNDPCPCGSGKKFKKCHG